MTTIEETSTEERLLQLLQYLGIEQAHFAGRNFLDLQGLATARPEIIASLTLVCPIAFEPGASRTLSSRLLLFHGNRGSNAHLVPHALPGLPGATAVTLPDYFDATWSDVVADRTEEVSTAMMDFLERVGQREGPGAVRLPEGEGEVAGITYRIQGSGPPLVLLPLSLAPSQWEPLLPRLGQRYCTITLGGAFLGIARVLEERDRAEGFRAMFRRLIDEVQLRPGETVLDVGCGTGALDRWLAQHTAGANPIVATDLNRYLLQEAAALARKEGMERMIAFQGGNAEALPFEESRFDVTVSVTVMEEVDADRMMAELVRVTRPGGRVAVIVRAVDLPWWVNLPLRAELKAKAEISAGAGLVERGCADAGLYRRFRGAGLSQVKMFPQLAAWRPGLYLQGIQARILAALKPEEEQEWRAAVAQAEAEGTFFMAGPFHCAIGTRP